MQILFKTSYDQDINLVSRTGEYIRVTVVILLSLAAPLILDDYNLGELGLLLVYVIAGIGLMILTGFTGQVSFGHAAFLGIGAYSHSILMTEGLPFGLSLVLTVALTGVIGMLLGRSASKMHGLYLAVATLAFLIIVETLIGEATDLTGGYSNDGSSVSAGISVASDLAFYYTNDIDLMDRDATLSFGSNISNMGRKISYSEDGAESFLPTNLRLGGNLKMEID